MSRTDAHTPYEYLPDGRDYYEHFLRVRKGDEPWHVGPKWEREWSKHFRREPTVHWFQVQENRKSRRQAKIALRRGDYDNIPTHGTGRHNARWLAW